MKHRFASLGGVLVLAALLAGCGEKEPQADPAALAAAFEEAPAAPAEAAETGPATAEAPAIPPADEGPPVQQLVNQAVTAMKKDEASEAMMLLQTLRSNPRLSPQQLTAVQDTMAGLAQELARRADAGDARAKQALELLNQRTRW
ncbi:MAG: hypothetical protein ACKVYV_00805 [Limisphaerales bacterium]